MPKHHRCLQGSKVLFSHKGETRLPTISQLVTFNYCRKGRQVPIQFGKAGHLEVLDLEQSKAGGVKEHHLMVRLQRLLKKKVNYMNRADEKA
jgi:hypothetical protein